jgi:hypothetical protein
VLVLVVLLVLLVLWVLVLVLRMLVLLLLATHACKARAAATLIKVIYVKRVDVGPLLARLPRPNQERRSIFQRGGGGECTFATE